VDRPPLIVLEVVLGFVVPIGWATWELISLRRDRKRQEREAKARGNPDPGEASVAKDDRQA
jgi:hypothetical protein